MLTVPPGFAAATVQREGRRGEQWIAELPALVEALLEDWQLELDGPVLSGYVAPAVFVRRRGGASAVLKVSWRDEETRHEHAALARWAGQGAAALLAADRERGALLLERLDPARSLEHVGEDEALSEAASVLRQLHVAPPAGLPTVRDRAERWWEELPRLWRDLGRPGDGDLVEAAVQTCADLGASPDAGVLLHGDFHYGNVLASSRRGWAAIDPKPLVGDGEFDVLPLLRNRWVDITAMGDVGRTVRRRLAYLCDAAGLDDERARRWSQARAVDDALWGERQGQRTFSDIAWAIAEALKVS